MGLTYYLSLFITLSFVVKLSVSYSHYPNISDVVPCPDYGEIEFAVVKPMDMGSFRKYAIHIECNLGYDLIGRHKIICNEGKWESVPRPQCIAKCDSPPDIENGALSLEGEKDKFGKLKKGSLATYTCNNGYKLFPPESKYRVCEKGIWTGAKAVCVLLSSCKQPKDIANGYYVQEKNGVIDGFGIGQRLHYSCNAGYVLEGPPVQQCLEDGTWSPRIPPNCLLEVTETKDESFASDVDALPCPVLPIVSHADIVVIRGQQNDLQASPGTEVEFRCEHGYRNTVIPPCERVLLRCFGGGWLGELPTCVPDKGCLPPPNIANGRILGVMAGQGPAQGQNLQGSVARYPYGSQVYYQCLPGYELRGNHVLSCSPSGCWEPLMHHPVCHPDAQFLDEYMTTSGTLLVSTATASGVMLILLAVCLVIVCRRRKPWGRRAQSISASVPHHNHHHLHHHHPTVAVGDAAAAALGGGNNHDPDRLALIAFADGMQANGQNSGLPTYEEAIRERSTTTGSSNTGLLGYRQYRPHWSVLGSGRRPRPQGQQNPDVHVTRQSSCTSHTASMRSGSAGDPMGSTDTMTPSEVSTNVTLDTVSSHSGSQPASCRAICGSLASFDTSSVLNTEGVPLLEENEQEETSIADNNSIGLEHRSIADNASFKYRRASPDLV